MNFKSRTHVAMAVAGVLLLMGAVGVSAATAAEPWWHVNSVSAPASQPGAEGELLLEVSNLGDEPVDGAAVPVTVVDSLPEGVVPMNVHGEGGGSFIVGLNEEFREYLQCGIAGRVVTCTFDGPLLSYERLMIAVAVTVAPGAGRGQSEVRVSGGDAAPFAGRRPLALEGVPPFGAENYELTPEEEGGALTTQAGSHPFQLTTTLTFNTQAVEVTHPAQGSEPAKEWPEIQPVQATRDLRFKLPAGLVGNPTALPACPIATFEKPSGETQCPADTVIGVATPIVTNPAYVPFVPLAESVPLYNLEPGVGEPARFGFGTPAGPVILDTSVLSGEGYAVQVTVPTLPDDLPFIGTQVTFWGVPGDSRHDPARGGECLGDGDFAGGLRTVLNAKVACPTNEPAKPFLVMPASCTGPLRTTVEGDSWQDIGQYTQPKEYLFATADGEPIGQDGCNLLDFEPSITVAPDAPDASTPTGLSVGVHVEQQGSLDPEGLAESTVKETTVTLPAGVGLNPAGANGLSACPLLRGREPQQEAAEEKDAITGINLETRQPADCPESSKVGTVEIKTPLLPNPLTGAVYLATQNANPFGSLIALYLVAYDPVSGVRVKLAGEVQPNPVTGQLVSTFKETPQLPFEDLTLHFFGGSRAPLGTPALCGAYTTTASIAPWSDNPAVESSSQFQITSGPEVQTASGPEKTPCVNPLPFAPTLTAGTTSIQAGGFSPFTMTMSREDGNQNLQSVQLHMPPGLLGTLSDVKLCGEPQADQGTCGPESLIGETTVSVGLGGNPYTVQGGKVYITGPYDGAPYGLSIVNPAKAGPFNLGNVIVRAKIEVNPSTAALTITTDPSGAYAIPHILDGIPLQIKHVNVNINRPNFTFNPTNCNKLAITGTLGSSEGSTSALSVPLQVTNCATLAFKPKLTASTSAKTSRLDGASLGVKLTYPAGPYDANIARVKVELPKQLPSRLPTLQKACLAETFEANPANCPPASIIGHATATTPVLPVPLTGPAYFVSHGGEGWPSLIIVLQGYGATVDLVGTTFISKTGVTSSTFKTIPDVPVGTFELTLPQGPYSALTTDGNLCQAKHLAMPTEFVGQNGALIHASTKIAVSGCPKARHAKRKRKKHAGRRHAKKAKKK